MSYFYIDNSFQNGVDFVLQGKIIEGEIDKGMNVLISMNNSFKMTLSIVNVIEIGTELEIYTGPFSSEELELLNELQIRNEQIEITI